MERLIEILQSIRPDVDFRTEEDLIDAGILDSLDVASIISELNDEYDIAIRVTELDPDNFNSVKAIYDLCMRLKKG
ncbi:MAG: phosphopantetheine-binding protein [Lewinella sp.]|uniref:phosphopantetheine-binding protein n=1 Tax=Lewinella sp. TaxID=2004506 RepID=UPI003D6B566D